jgi:hypothetical protein
MKEQRLGFELSQLIHLKYGKANKFYLMQLRRFHVYNSIKQGDCLKLDVNFLLVYLHQFSRWHYLKIGGKTKRLHVFWTKQEQRRV